MKSRTLTSILAITLFAVLATPMLAAQEQKKEHTRYDPAPENWTI